MVIQAALAFALAIACATAAASPQDFSVPATFGTEGANVDAAVLADFDGDGDNDVAWASRANGRVSMLPDAGAAGARATLLQVASVSRLATADVDLDGRPDLVTAANGTLAFHRNTGVVTDGVPQFDSRPAIGNVSNITALALADMNRDGRADLVVARNGVPVLQVFFFTAGNASRFTTATAVAGPVSADRTNALAIADFDNDGQRDIVATGNLLAGGISRGGQVFLVPRLANGGFAAAITLDSESANEILRPGFNIGAVVTLHFDVQNGPDVAYAINDGADSRLVILRNDGTRIATPRIVADEGDSSYRALAAEDLDRDGDDDLVYASSGGAIAWLENPSTGAAPARHLVDQGQAGLALFVDDDDLDGDFDLHRVHDTGTLAVLRNVSLHGNPFIAGNQRILSFTGRAGPFEVVTRQLRRGPRREAVITEFTAGTVSTLASTRSGFFKLSTGINSPVMSDVGAARELSVGDFDHDGDDDFLLATGESGEAPPANQNRLHISSNGTPPLNATLACTGDDIRGLAAGDLREPGFAAVYAAEDEDKIAVFSNCSQQTIISTVGNGIPNGPTSAKLGDLDQDGDLDLAIAARHARITGDRIGDLVGWYPNLGAGAFGPLVRIATVVGARDVTLADYDRDGRLDVIAGSGAAGIELFRNLGGGVFAVPVVAATGIVGPNRVEAADLDHDGDIDLVVPSASETGRGPSRAQCGITVLLSNGDGSFDFPFCADDLLVGNLPWTRTAVDDIDGNGMPDIVATANADGVVMLWSPDAPVHFVALDDFERPARILEPGVEQCVSHADGFHLGRSGDADLEFAAVTANALGTQGTGLVDALVLRADDGDFIAEPDADPAIAVAHDTTLVGGNVTWTFTPAHRQPMDGLPHRYWLCVQPLSATSPNPQVLELSLLQFPGVRNADSGTAARSRVLRGEPRIRLQGSAIFRDGLETLN